MLRFFHSILENPRIYEFVQRMLGGDRVFQAIRAAVETELRHITYKNVLEVGCGTGLTRDCFNADYTGIDINPEYIKVISRRSEGTYLVGDATSLPFGPESYDLVFTVGVLHHLDQNNRDMMLREMDRVCKKGGHILIVDGLVPSNRWNLIGYVLAKLDRGRYKMRISRFQDMIRTAYPGAFSMTFKKYYAFPLEFAAVAVRKDNEPR